MTFHISAVSPPRHLFTLMILGIISIFAIKAKFVTPNGSQLIYHKLMSLRIDFFFALFQLGRLRNQLATRQTNGEWSRQ